MAKILHVYSGGMDSTVLLYDLLSNRKNEIECINFNYGSKHNVKERDCAVMMCGKLDIPLELINLDFINELFKSSLLSGGEEIPEGHYQDKSMKKTVVPFRNGIILSIAAGYAESNGFETITIANHSGDHAIYPDCRPAFINSMRDAILFGTYNEILIKSPYCNMNKREIALIGKELNVPFNLTWTCYKGLAKHCGKCGACTERKEALMGFDNTEYE